MSGKRASRAVLVAHVLRRLSMGPQPDLVAEIDGPDAAIARALELRAPAPTPPAIAAPTDFESARVVSAIAEPIAWWLTQMQTSPRLVEERLVWFWHDHFATGLQKVRVPYLMWQQHLLVRQHATKNFATLLKAISRDPAMLVYLDGVTNSVREINENFGREVMELFTLGHGNYTERDVVEASRAFTGWVVSFPGRPAAGRLAELMGAAAPWSAVFVSPRFDAGTKTLLGTTGALDMDGALDVLLEHEATAMHVASKLSEALVGRRPSSKTAKRLGKVFRDADYDVMPLVEAIVADEAFLAPASIGARARTPVEKLVGLIQAIPPQATTAPDGSRRGRGAGPGNALRTLGFVPFVPPNVAGFPTGTALLGPHQLVHTFDLLSVYPSRPPVPASLDELLARFALFDVSERTRRVLRRETDPARRLALVVASPEYAVV